MVATNPRAIITPAHRQRRRGVPRGPHARLLRRPRPPAPHGRPDRAGHPGRGAKDVDAGARLMAGHAHLAVVGKGGVFDNCGDPARRGQGGSSRSATR